MARATIARLPFSNTKLVSAGGGDILRPALQ